MVDAIVSQLAGGVGVQTGWMQGNGIGVEGKLHSALPCNDGLALYIDVGGKKSKRITWKMDVSQAEEIAQKFGNLFRQIPFYN